MAVTVTSLFSSRTASATTSTVSKPTTTVRSAPTIAPVAPTTTRTPTLRTYVAPKTTAPAASTAPAVTEVATYDLAPDPQYPQPLVQSIPGVCGPMLVTPNALNTPIVKAEALGRAIRCNRLEDGLLHPVDAYAKGVIQGFQRAVAALGAQFGRPYAFYADGVFNEAFLQAAFDAIAMSGIPRGVLREPKTDEDLCLDARAFAEQVAIRAGVQTNFTPGETLFMDSRAFDTALKKKGLFSSKNVILGAAAISGLFFLRG